MTRLEAGGRSQCSPRAGAAGFYERLGWERWRGVSYTLSEEGEIPDNEHGGLMILRLDPLVVPNLTVDVTCKDRPGDAW